MERPNWVRERGHCTPAMALRSLAEIVKQDVQEMNGLPTTRESNRAYRVVCVSGEQQFKVEQHQQQPSVLLNTCVFEVLDEKKVRVRPPVPIDSFCVSICWDTTNDQCIYQIDDRPVALWQVSKRALEALFFD